MTEKELSNFPLDTSDFTIAIGDVHKAMAMVHEKYLGLFQVFSTNPIGYVEAVRIWEQLGRQIYPEKEELAQTFNIHTQREMLSLLQRLDLPEQRDHGEPLKMRKRLVFISGAPGAGKTSLFLAWSSLIESVYRGKVKVGYVPFDTLYYEFEKTRNDSFFDWGRITWLRLAVQMKRQFVKIESELLKEGKDAVVFCEIPGVGDPKLDRCRAFMQHMLRKYPQDVLCINLASNSLLRKQAAADRQPKKSLRENLFSLMADKSTIDRISRQEIIHALEWEFNLKSNDPARLKIKALQNYLDSLGNAGLAHPELKQLAITCVYWWIHTEKFLPPTSNEASYSGISVPNRDVNPLQHYYPDLQKRYQQTAELLSRPD